MNGRREHPWRIGGAGSILLAIVMSPLQGESQPAAGGVAGPTTTVVDVVIQGQTACALRTDGRVICWGSNEHGELAAGRLSHEGGPVAVDRPMPIAGIEPADALTVDADGVCARSRTGIWRCWGLQRNHGSGDVVTVPTVVPEHASRLERRATYDRECTLGPDGTVRCRGSDERTNGGSRDGATFTPIEGMAQATHLALGEAHTCAATANGSVYCWGLGRDGQLGAAAVETCRDGADDNAPCARRPLRVEGLGRVVEVGADRSNTCARTSEGNLLCWGRNWTAVLAREASSSRPVPWGGPPVEQFAMTPNHRCAVATDHSVWCIRRQPPGEGMQAPTRVDGIENAVRVAVGEDFGCALERSGQVRCWGEDASGQLGDGAFDPPWRQGPDRVRQVVAGFRGAYVLLRDGTVHFTPEVSAPGSDVFRPVAGVAAARELVGGYSHTCAVLEGGGVRCWGNNETGQLGVGDLALHPSAVEPPGLPPVVSLASDFNTTCGWTASGEVWCWGDVAMFARGRRQGEPAADRALRPRRIRALRRVRRMVLHDGWGCALDDRGAAQCWGPGAGCRGPVRTAALRGATHLGIGAALLWRTPPGRWMGYIPYNVCEDAGDHPLDNCHVSIAARQTGIEGFGPELRGLSAAAESCAGYSVCGVDDSHRLRCTGEAGFRSLSGRV